MSISLTSPAALWLLAAIPAVWLARRYGRTNFNPRQQVVQAVVRSLLLAALAFALARPVMSTGSSRLSIVYLVDVSHSISSNGINAAAARIDALQTSVRPAHAKILAFAADATVVADTAALRKLATIDPASKDAALVRRDGSDLERALSEARAELLPGYLPRIVLLSDGRETSGDARAAVTRLAADGIPVSVEAIGVRDIGDTWVEAIQLPERLAAGALIQATVHIGSQREASATVAIRDGARELARREVPIARGTTAVPLEITLPAAGARAIEATVTVAGDPLKDNDSLRREAAVRAPAKVLYVEGAPASAKYLAGALNQAGFDVAVRAPSDVPKTTADLAPWDAVILSDVARSAISNQSMTALADWVEHDGGGLLVAGGDSVFGEGGDGAETGYRKTELERLMPVTFERKDEPEVALIIVLDRSWSMAGQVMELCKAAAQAAIDVMSDEQSVGLITFNDGMNWEFTLRNVGRNRDAIRKSIAAIEPAGHTLIFPAVEQAFLALKDARARAKHVVLLSDGRSYPDDYEGLVKKMVAAKMTVSAISVGPAADVELLTNIAKWGKGRSYVVEDAKEVPQIFVKEAKNAMTPAFDEGKTIKPVLKARGFLEDVDMSKMPGLRGRTATVLKDAAFELMATEEGDPLLAFWPIGLGRTAVFASDVKDRWASDWVRWRGYGPFFSALLHAIERPRPAPLQLEITPGAVRGSSRTLGVSIEARDAQGRYRDQLKPELKVVAADGTTAQMTARQVAPGRYEGSLIADATQALTISLVGEDASGAAVRLVLPDLQAEYRFRAPDEALLASIARATGGTVQPTAESLTKTSGVQQTARRALWPWLVVAGLFLWLADILLRRVRIFEGTGVFSTENA